jgi:transposase
MKDIKVLGIDLAKNVFQIHGTDRNGKCLMRKTLSRLKFMEFLSNLNPCIIGMEACGGSHHWARVCQSKGHEVRMMSPQFVKPYVKSNKSDRNDAEAIAEACMRPSMRFVAVKTTEQQDMLILHRARELAIKQRTAQSNQIRGFLSEYGIVLSTGNSSLRKLMIVIEDNESLAPPTVALFKELYETFKIFDARVKKYDSQIGMMAKQDTRCQELQKIDGVGPLTASAVIATVGDAKTFRNGREMSAWLGLVPKQNSSGGKTVLGGISKRGDCYVRKLLIQGARTFVKICDTKTDRLGCWVLSKKVRGGFNKAAVALANKNVRMMWAVMARGESYRHPE